MKKNKKWSILIWSIFLVVFLSFSFIYISLKIQNQIQSNTNTSLFSWQDNIVTQDLVEQNTDWILKDTQNLTFQFKNTQSGIISIVYGWPIEYQISSWGVVSSEWYIFDKTSVIPIQWKLLLKNIGWITKVKVNADSFSGVTFPYSYEKSSITIWGKEFVSEITKKN